MALIMATTNKQYKTLTMTVKLNAICLDILYVLPSGKKARSKAGMVWETYATASPRSSESASISSRVANP